MIHDSTDALEAGTDTLPAADAASAPAHPPHEDTAVVFSVVVVTYHRGDFLQGALDSIYAQEDLPGPFEIILIDNGGDAVVAPSPRADVSLRIERPGRNLGVPGGRNLGIALAASPYLVFLDDDAVWHDTRDLARFLPLFAAHPRCGCVAVKILNPHSGAPERHMVPAPNKDRLLNAATPIEAPYFYGCAHALRVEAVRRAGPYPERLMYGMEEIDLSLRLVDAGYTILFDPSIAALHYQAQAGRDIVGSAYWKQHALNKTRVAWRLLPLPYPLTIGIIWSGAALVKTGRPDVVAEIWRALWRERTTLRRERQVIAPSTIRYLKRIGARLFY